MKYLLTLLLFILTLTSVSAQKKPAKKEQVPTQKEMDDMLKEMQSALDEMSPEDKKMMDSLGMKMPDPKQMKKMADFAKANADLTTERIVPIRDAARIAAIPKVNLTTATMPAYLQSLNQKIEAGIPGSIVAKTNTLYEDLRKKYQSSTAIANAAVACWSFGKPGPAIILLSRASKEDPSNTDHLNNLAALMNMTGAEHLAIPLLQFLNKKYPKNSTILNNIAHAWYGLGDLQKASLYIDSTIRICAWHPQANQIKAAIAESKGNTTEAINAMRQSISRMHSSEKEQKLKELGYDLKSDDIVWSPPRKSDGLGLSKFVWPEFPKTVETSERVKKNWSDFRKDIDRIQKKMEAEGAELHAIYQKSYQERLMQDKNANKNGVRTSAVFSNLSPKAIRKLQPGINQLLEQEGYEPMHVLADKLREVIRGYSNRESEELKELEKAFKGKMGEGTGIPSEYCKALDGIHDRFLKDANTAAENFLKKISARVYTRINEMAHFNLYRLFPEEQDFQNHLLKTEWIGVMAMATDLVYFRDPTSLCVKRPEPKRNPLVLLPDFDEVNCVNKSELNLVLGSIRTECGRTIAEIEIDFVKLGWETKSANREENRNFIDEFQRCTIEISAGTGRKFGDGPLQLQTTAGATGFMEIDRSGLKDAGIKVNAEAKVKTNVLDTKVETDIGEVNVGPGEQSVSLGGVNATISINSGFTASGSGILKGLKL